MRDIDVEGSGNLLIVDDLAVNLRVLSNTLSNYGYRIRAVRSGAMALVGAKTAPPDVILLDIRMPEMDGYEVCRQLKSDPQTCDIPIIFLSALDEVEDKAKAFAVGGADYVTKPFQTEEVLARVRNQLSIQQLKRQVTQQKQQLDQLASLSSSPLIGLPPGSAGDDLNAARSIALSAIHTILSHSTQLRENPAMDLAHHAALQAIHLNGQTLLNLLNSQPASPQPASPQPESPQPESPQPESTRSENFPQGLLS